MIMYIKLINCSAVHIYQESAYVYTDSAIYVLDEISSRFVELLRHTSEYDKLLNAFEKSLNFARQEAVDTIQEIIDVNKKFFSFSDTPNNICITGRCGMAYPHMLQISLTNRCVHNCRHCFKNCVFTGKSLSYSVITGLLDQISSECKSVEFTGGEPFLHNDIMNLVTRYQDKISFNVTTSGFILHQFNISDLKKFHLIQISLHGSTEQMHDAFVGKNGSFKMVTKNIKWLCDNELNVVLSRTIVAFDKKELEGFINLCISLGVKRLILGIILPLGRAVQNNCATANEECRRLEEFLEDSRNKYKEISIAVDNETAVSNKPSKYVFHCIGGRLHWYVNEDGAVYPCTYCQREELSIGNLIDNPDLFNEIIYNGKYEEYNQRIANNFYVINDLYRYQKLSINDICSNIREAEIQDKL